MGNEIDRVIDDYEDGRLSRRGLIAGLLAALGAAPVARAAGDSTFSAVELNHVALAVTDVPRSRAFYEAHLGLETTSGGERSSFLSCGPHFLALFRSRAPGLAHYCYTIRDYDPARVAERLESAGLRPRRAGNRVYFDDPDGIEVQLAAPNR